MKVNRTELRRLSDLILMIEKLLDSEGFNLGEVDFEIIRNDHGKVQILFEIE